MGKPPTNLRRYRKRRAGEEQARQASRTRLQEGLTAAERRRAAAERTRRDRVLESHRLDPEKS